MATVALLSNPRSTGNRAILPRVRSFCASRPDLFHYEVEHVDQIGDALKSIARVKPKVLVINGGDGTVQAALTELHRGGHFEDAPPPVAVLPNGKTNLIALDLGAVGDPLAALERIMALAGGDLTQHLVQRELIALSEDGKPPVFGMFLGGGGLADAILYCRHKIYPLGLPNGLSHVLATIASFLSVALGISAKFLPDVPQPMRISLIREGVAERRFALLIVTTLEKMLMGARATDEARGLKLMAIERSVMPVIRALVASARGKVGEQRLTGVHVEQGDMIRIESDRASVILDGETYRAESGRPIMLRSTAPVPFLRLAA